MKFTNNSKMAPINSIQELYSVSKYNEALSGDMEVTNLATLSSSLPVVDLVESHNLSTGC